MKKLVSAVMLLSLIFSLVSGVGARGAAAAVLPKLYLNGIELQSSVAPKVVNQLTMVPLRVVSEGIGFQVDWISPTVQVGNGASKIVLTLGSSTAVVNDQEIELDSAPFAESNTTFVPLRFVSQNLGLGVEWDQQAQSVHLYQSSDTNAGNDSGSSADGGNASDGSGQTDSGSLNPGGNASNGENGGDEEGMQVNALLKAIDFDGINSVYLPYDGTMGEMKTTLLHSPERIVFDLPNTAFDAGFATPFTNLVSQTGEITVDTHVSLQKIRFSLFSDKPSTIRVVLDVASATNYEVLREPGAIVVRVLDPIPGEITPPPTANPDPSTGIYKVVIDAGHGGKDPGAPSVIGKYEKEFNFAVAKKVMALLDKETRIQGIMTRSTDTFVELDGRVKIANDAKADLFISIHANRAASSSVSGVETYYTRANSKAFADIMHKHLVKGTGLKDRKVRTANFRVIKYTTMPAVLLECGYLSNKNDTSVLFTDAKQNQLAAEIVSGIKEYLKLN
ncbi:N-acetylmuramoyl-L-alanine amidase [Paenibacillus methanolicus]|uniref:N-acetylmuramoyl-L-alanine amidase n=1 Tax=Paenibacillus methanolicus TaxID=582686 RepID=A0A5S5C3V3_9BACL|nr:N-acetylmuramoyl-L-alanine amidase [Paenibacillus methanolicus]TYP72633.1 N-acetylmuramoyl-L-alanine amidase [Paenibacillus methanolicus]